MATNRRTLEALRRGRVARERLEEISGLIRRAHACFLRNDGDPQGAWDEGMLALARVAKLAREPL